MNSSGVLLLATAKDPTDQVEHSELYVVEPTLWETDRDARLAEIKAHTTAIQREVIAREATKKLANQRSAAHTSQELWEVVTNSVATARAANQPLSLLTFGPLFGVLLPTVSNELLLWVITALPLPFKREHSLQLSRMPLRPLRHHPKRLRKPMAQFML
ncbi:hypothetical protein DYB26_015125 [Aphanomyces astaci]|uniref:Uncharacterized protein n=1 Tax=Aphanomyces astaci TaxID=112090 RepID=A0A3R6ZWB6_APHAT|nr:hypothetical protein DYB26_015125 [Aphanomyces astaci]